MASRATEAENWIMICESFTPTLPNIPTGGDLRCSMNKKPNYWRKYTALTEDYSMIKRVDVYRNYELNVELNMNIRQFFLGMEERENNPITA